MLKYNCIICDFEIKAFDKPLEDGKPEQACYSNGVVERTHAGYGSLLDGDMFIVGICDKCLDKKCKDGKIQYVGDYMFPEQSEMGFIGLKDAEGI